MSVPFAAQVYTYYVVAHHGAGRGKRQPRIVEELHMTRDEARVYRQSAETLTHPDHYLYTATDVRQRYAKALAEWDTREVTEALGFE
jgi:hypothetical protein